MITFTLNGQPVTTDTPPPAACPRCCGKTSA